MTIMLIRVNLLPPLTGARMHPEWTTTQGIVGDPPRACPPKTASHLLRSLVSSTRMPPFSSRVANVRDKRCSVLLHRQI